MYAAGDSDNEEPNRDPDNSPLVAAIAGPAGDQAKAWARKLNTDLGLKNDNPLFDGLAVAKSGSSTALPNDLPTNHLATGTGNWYVRGSFDESTVWGVFQCSHRLVDDHQHNDAGNWVLTRGGDDLVVDPTPYGSVSTLSSNAPAIDSSSLPEGYSPSQGYWGTATHLAWARQTGSGVAAARCDYADQFARDDVPSDVSHALRDYVLVPDGDSGEVVLIDRAVTGDAGRGLHLRVRTPASLSLASNRATGTLGSSALAVERVYSSSGTPSVRSMPHGTECASSDHSCDFSRIPTGSEYRLDVAGPSALAIHVVAARGQAAGTHTQLTGDGYRGVVIPRAGSPVAVVTNDAADGAVQSSFVYSAPAAALHVVVDAPADANGKSDVSATLDGSSCKVTVKPHTGSSGGFDGAPLMVRLSSSCAVEDDGSQDTAAPADPGGSSNPPSDAGQGGTSSSGTGGTSAQGGSSETSGSSTGAQGSGAQAGSAGTGGSGGTGGHRFPRKPSIRRHLPAGATTNSLSPQNVGADELAQGGGADAAVGETAGGLGCSVASTPAGGAGGSLATAVLGALLVLRQRRRRLLAR